MLFRSGEGERAVVWGVAVVREDERRGTEDETLTEQLDRLAFEAEFFFVKAEK